MSYAGREVAAPEEEDEGVGKLQKAHDGESYAALARWPSVSLIVRPKEVTRLHAGYPVFRQSTT